MLGINGVILEKNSISNDLQNSENQSGINFGSEEISDQDLKFQKIMEKRLGVTSVEYPPTRDSGFYSFVESTDNVVRTVFSEVSHLSDNSSNAVDNQISDANSRVNYENVHLSFNGTIERLKENNENNNTLLSNDDNNNRNKSDQQYIDDTMNLYTEIINNKECNEQSPSLFSNTDLSERLREVENVIANNENDDVHEDDMKILKTDETKLIEETDKLLYERQKEIMSAALPPPPSVTIVQHDVKSLLLLYNKNMSSLNNKINKNVDEDLNVVTQRKCSNITHTSPQVMALDWPNCMFVNAYDVYYNRTPYSERIETLQLRIIDRFIGAETSSSFIHHSSSPNNKIRNNRMKKLMQSPGSRLSHLARRRIAFSSLNTLSSNPSKLGNSQLMIDVSKKCSKRVRIVTPKKRITPGKKKSLRRTPLSNNKRQNQVTYPVYNKMNYERVITRETSKRALFQSPAKEQNPIQFKPEIASRIDKSKRALLFSPPKNQQSEKLFGSTSSVCSESNDSGEIINLKRKREDDYISDDSTILGMQPLNSTKFLKSHSFCGSFSAENRSNDNNSLLNTFTSTSFTRTQSECAVRSNNQLSTLHRQKILWAASKALQKKQINSNHVNYKKYGTKLVQILKKLFLEIVDVKTERTSEILMKIANRIVIDVIKEKSACEIYYQEKVRLKCNTKNKPKLSGYISQSDYELHKKQFETKTFGLGGGSTSTLFSSENSLESMNSYDFSQCDQKDGKLKPSFDFKNIENNFRNFNPNNSNSTSTTCTSTITTAAATTTTTTTDILRENVDIEQRQKSAQKIVGFSGKDQKNVSPYNDKLRTSSLKKQNKNLINQNANVLKAKRQIKFDG